MTHREHLQKVSLMNAPAANVNAREFLTFTLAAEEYGIDILSVQEIRGYDAVTSIANAPVYIKGVINLRGIIVPIVDLRMKFNLPSVTYNEFTVVIIINFASRIAGIVVDGVTDVVSLSQENIKPPPEFGAAFDTKYLTGLGVNGENMLILVDIARLMSSAEMGLMAAV